LITYAFERGKGAAALNQIARTAGSHQVASTFLAALRPWNDEVDRHDQRVLEARHAVESAILTAVPITLEDAKPLFQCHRLRATNEIHEIGYRHTTPP
jgi:hypothetical protein